MRLNLHEATAGIGFLAVAFLCIAVGAAGCKKQQAEKQGKQPSRKSEKAEQAGPEKKPGITAEPQADISDDAGDEAAEGPAAGAADKGKEPGEMEIIDPVSPEEVDKPSDKPGPSGGTPSADTINEPAIDKERLEKVFITLWCAEQAGASSDELLDLYHKFDYPPLANWHGVWNIAISDTIWARTVLEKAKSHCWNVVKDKEKKKKPELKTPAPGEQKKKE